MLKLKISMLLLIACLQGCSLVPLGRSAQPIVPEIPVQVKVQQELLEQDYLSLMQNFLSGILPTQKP